MAAALLLAGGALLLAGLGGWAAWAAPGSVGDASWAQAALPPDSLSAMASRCEAQMISDTCRAQADRSPLPSSSSSASASASASSSAAPAQAPAIAPVFLAGVGRIDGRAYAEIRANGQAMCQAALADCRRDLGSPRCRVARQLWSPAAR